jgi:hypothetical protein
MVFCLYDVETRGSPLWTETKNVAVSGGLFNTLLGDTTSLDLAVFDGRSLWLGVTVGADPEATPRMPVSYAPYALYAGNAGKLGDEPPDAFAQAGHNHLEQTWNLGTNTNGLILNGAVSWANGLFVAVNRNNGPSIWGWNDGGGNAVRGDGWGNSLGVYGQGENNVGVVGQSSGDAGVAGISSASGRSGVYGRHEGTGWGVYGSSASGFGVGANGGGDGAMDDGIGDLALYGAIGEIYSFTEMGLDIYSDGSILLDLDQNNDSSNGFTIFNGANGLVFTINESGEMWAMGPKHTIVETQSAGQRSLTAIESPAVWFEDFGTATLANGEVVVTIDPSFAETISPSAEYHVFLTPLGDCAGLYVTAKTATSFTVRELRDGKANVSFDYRITAKRRGYENVRLPAVPEQQYKLP